MSSPSIHDEASCSYVSTCGLSLVCDQPPTYFGREIKYSWNTTDTKLGTTVYVHCRNLPNLAQGVHLFSAPIVIVVNGDDNLFPSDYPQDCIKTLIESPKVLAIYAQNMCVVGHPKCKHIPIGLDYHTLNWERGGHLWGRTGMLASQQEALLKACKTKMKSLSESKVWPIVTNFQLAMDSPPRRAALRKPVYEALKDKSWMKWLPEQSRKDFWLALHDVVFVLCAPGNGFDTHRAWEVLALGRIPIVQKLPINVVYEGLPVWEVEDWNAFASLTEEEFSGKAQEFIAKFETYEWERLTLAYWKKELNAYKE
jgi:hypothetical protein